GPAVWWGEGAGRAFLPPRPSATGRSTKSPGVLFPPSPLVRGARPFYGRRPCRWLGLLPLPLGEGWGEGFRPLARSEPPHPNPLPDDWERAFAEFAVLCAD